MASFISHKGTNPTSRSPAVQEPQVQVPEVVELSSPNVPLNMNPEDHRDTTQDMPFAGTTLPQDGSSEPERGITTYHGKGFQKGNKAAVGRKPKLARLGIDLKLVNVADPRYQQALKRAQFYQKARSEELSHMFGQVSIAVNAMLASSALQHAASRYLQMLAAENCTNMSLFLEIQKVCSQLQSGAMKNDLAAYELCAKETQGGAKKHVRPAWLTVPQDDDT